MKRLWVIKKYVVIDGLLVGNRLVSLRDYKNNPILQCHPVLAQGTIKHLKKMGWLA
jgi:hypothetical protein